MSSVPGLCFVHPNPAADCETFIQAQIDALAPVLVLHGGHMPLYEENGKRLFPGLSSDWRELFSPDCVPKCDTHSRAAEELASLFQQRGVRLVLAEYGPTGVALAEPCRLAGIPLAVHFHGFDASLQSVLEKYRHGYARVFEQAVALVAVSSEMVEDLAHFGASREKIHLLPYGVDTSLFQPAISGEAPPRCAAVGRFVDKKAPETTLLAFAQVLEQLPEARLTMAGDGPLRLCCMRLARHLGITQAVDFPGSLPHHEVAKLLQSSRCFVQHSVTAESGDKEGMPNAVLEAGAVGLPVVATRHAGIPEAVEHGVSGLLCKEHDLQAMAQNMLVLLTDPERASRMGHAGRARMKRLFEAHDRLGALAALLRNLLHTAASGEFA